MKVPTFDVPTQVRFYDVNGDHYIGGIAYNDYVICGCCGGVIPISEIFEDAPYEVVPLFIYEHWVDIQEEITGGFFGRETGLKSNNP